MKTSELKEFIRPIIMEEVKKEVQKQLPKLLFEMLAHKNNKQIVKEVNNGDDPVEETIVERRPTPALKTNPQPTQKKVIKKYVKDPLLNQILNETTPGLPQTPYGTSLVDLSGGGFDKVGVSDEFKNDMRQLMSESVDETGEISQEPPQPSPIPNLFNKNFKAILDKSKQKGIGGGGFSNVLQGW